MDPRKTWLFTREQLANTPSRKCGIPAEKEANYRRQASSFIRCIGQKLNLPQECYSKAVIFMHRFYMLQSFTQFDRNVLSLAALFFVTKLQEHHKKGKDVFVKLAHSCLYKDEPPLKDPSPQFDKQVEALLFNEYALLATLGFDFDIDLVHSHILQSDHIINATKAVTRVAYDIATNSLEFTTMCLQYPPTAVACFCLQLACQWTNSEIPAPRDNKPWYNHIDAFLTQELIDHLIAKFRYNVGPYFPRLQEKIMSIYLRDSPHSLRPSPCSSPWRTEPLKPYNPIPLLPASPSCSPGVNPPKSALPSHLAPSPELLPLPKPTPDTPQSAGPPKDPTRYHQPTSNPPKQNPPQNSLPTSELPPAPKTLPKTQSFSQASLLLKNLTNSSQTHLKCHTKATLHHQYHRQVHRSSQKSLPEAQSAQNPQKLHQHPQSKRPQKSQNPLKELPLTNNSQRTSKDPLSEIFANFHPIHHPGRSDTQKYSSKFDMDLQAQRVHQTLRTLEEKESCESERPEKLERLDQTRDILSKSESISRILGSMNSEMTLGGSDVHQAQEQPQEARLPLEDPIPRQLTNCSQSTPKSSPLQTCAHSDPRQLLGVQHGGRKVEDTSEGQREHEKLGGLQGEERCRRKESLEKVEQGGKVELAEKLLLKSESVSHILGSINTRVTPEVAEEAPEVAEEAPEVAEEAPEVAESKTTWEFEQNFVDYVDVETVEVEQMTVESFDVVQELQIKSSQSGVDSVDSGFFSQVMSQPMSQHSTVQSSESLESAKSQRFRSIFDPTDSPIESDLYEDDNQSKKKKKKKNKKSKRHEEKKRKDKAESVLPMSVKISRERLNSMGDEDHVSKMRSEKPISPIRISGGKIIRKRVRDVDDGPRAKRNADWFQEDW